MSSDTGRTNTFASGQMSLESLWRLLEQQGRTNASMASVVGLDESKFLVQDRAGAPKHGMTTIELVIVQAILLAVLILLSVIWACCCKKRCIEDPSNVSISGLRSLARKLSTSSTRTLPPSYSKVDLTSVGLTLNDHLNPPPTYDRLIAMLESGEITSVPIHLHPEVERRMSMASTYSANSRSRRESNSSSRKSSKQSIGSSADGSRKSSRVTFAPNLIHGPRKGSRKESSQSLKLTSVLSHSDRRKTSSKSEGAAIDSRKVSFIDELTGMSARSDPKFEEQLQQQLKIVKEAGELGEFVQNSKPNSSAAAATSTISSNEVVERREENINNNLPDTNEEKEKKIRNLK
jgi:hypothetical protein